MGQFAHIEIPEAVEKYFSMRQYATPKLLRNELYPIFKTSYSRDTFRRLIHRELKHLKESGFIVEHPLRPYYYLKNEKSNLDFDLVLAVRRGRFGILNLDAKFFNVSVPGPGLTFAEYFRSKNDK